MLPSTTVFNIDSLRELKNATEFIKDLGNSKVTDVESIRGYVRLREDYVNQSLDFLRRNDYCIVIEAENGVLGFSSEGKEIFREIPYKYDWKIRLIETILNELGEF